MQDWSHSICLGRLTKTATAWSRAEVSARERGADRVITDFVNSPESLALAAHFPEIAKARVRRPVLDLARAMVDEAEQSAPCRLTADQA